MDGGNDPDPRHVAYRFTHYVVSYRVVCGVRVRFFFFQAEDGIRDLTVTGVQTCALPISAVALATDFNPGSSPTLGLSLVMALGVSQLGLRYAEVVSAVTVNAAAALGLDRKSVV